MCWLLIWTICTSQLLEIEKENVKEQTVFYQGPKLLLDLSSHSEFSCDIYIEYSKFIDSKKNLTFPE